MTFFEISYICNLNFTYQYKNNELKKKEKRTNVIYVN